MKEIQIGNRLIGLGHPCFIIAEAGVNHDGDLEKAKRLIDVAVEAKADAVKFQSFHTDKLLLLDLDKCQYQKVGDGEQGTYAEMIRRLEISQPMHHELFDHCQKKGIMFLSTPFDEESVDLLDTLGVKAFKIDSGNLNNPRLVKHIASKNKPVFLSTGMATIGEIDEAVKNFYSTGNHQLILLHCTSNYPPNYADVNLKAMDTLSRQFELPVGYSDHTKGLSVSLAAAALEAVVIEKHFTLDRSARGPDHLASVEPQELIDLVKGIRIINLALGNTKKEPVSAEIEVANSLRRSLVAVKFIPKNTIITSEMIDIKRPGNGLSPKYYDLIIGRIAREDIPINTLIKWSQI